MRDGLELSRAPGMPFASLLLAIVAGLAASSPAVALVPPQRPPRETLLPNGLRLDCGRPPFSTWNSSTCPAGAAARRWSISPTGQALGHDLEKCKAWSCASKRAAWASPHLAVEPQDLQAAPDSLVVFLHGTGVTPQECRGLLLATAKAGHYVIGLSYLSQPVPVSATDSWCSPHPPGSEASPGECNAESHEQVLFGRVNASLQGKSAGFWQVPPEDSVEQLLAGALSRLPWGASFLDSGAVRWSRIIISGHSQGASHAAYLSSLLGVRAVLFSGPQDCLQCSSGWLRTADHSVLRRSLFHEHEECGQTPERPAYYCEKDLLRKNLRLVGLPEPARWSGGPPPPGGVASVMSVVPPRCNGSRPFHNSVALDSCAPMGQGIAELWTALFSGLGVASLVV
mmetsp:Transcript_151694/g.467609  ORF Transcript_151694/g.467609 Transcript_151694/m.467609 type:complete len:398 (-) Transcript_151694:6-1199(-)